MNMIFSVNANDKLRLALIDYENGNLEWRLALPIDKYTSHVPEKNSKEEIELMGCLTEKEKENLVLFVEKISRAYQKILHSIMAKETIC